MSLMHSISTIVVDVLYIIWNVIFYTVTDGLAYLSRLVHPVNKSLNEDIILITGAGSGLGRALCIELAKHCHTLIGWDIDGEALMESSKILAEQGHKLHTYVCDLRDRESIMSTAERVLHDLGPVTILINNAGIVSGQNVLDLKPTEIEDCFRVNVFSHFYTVQAFLPYMMGLQIPPKPGPSGDCVRGHIITIASVVSTVPGAGLSDYCASKAACSMMSESLEQELALRNLQDDIYLTRVYPFLINTKMFRGCAFNFPWLFRTLDVTYCARRIVQAIRANERDVYINARYSLFPLMKCLLPRNTFWQVQKLGGSHKLLQQLQEGRADTAKLQK